MSEATENSLATAEAILQSLANPNEMTRSQAVLYSRSICHAWETEVTWQSEWSPEQLDDAVRLIQAAKIFKDQQEYSKAAQAYRRAGELLEWLSKSQDNLIQKAPLALLSGAAFQLGGFPAMAAALLAEPSMVMARGESLIYIAFLKAEFHKTVILCIDFWAAYPNDKNEMHVGSIICDDIIRCLGLISWAFYSGEQDRLNFALEKLKLISNFALTSMTPYTWLLLNMLEETANKYKESSIWPWVEKMENTINGQGKFWLKQYAKIACRNKKPLAWPSQQEGIEKLISLESFAMCTPTASGKTTVAQLGVLQGLFPKADEEDIFDFGGPAPLVIVLTPSRALSAETEFKMEKIFSHKNNDIQITGMYGGTEWSLAEVWLSQDKPTILVCTVEKAEALLRYAGKHILDRLSLIIIDEAHQILLEGSKTDIQSLVEGNNRSARLESFASRLFSMKPELRAIALSAVAFGAEKSIAAWICKDEKAHPLGANYRSTRQLIGQLTVFSNKMGQIQLERLNDQELRLENGETPFIPLKFAPMPKVKTNFTYSLYAFTDASVFWIAMNLASQKRTILISVPSGIDTTISRFSELITSKHWDKKYPTFFTFPEKQPYKKLYETCLDAVADFCGKESNEYKLISRGIAVHYGQLPTKLRQLIVKIVEEGIMPITVATSTLTEGVNLPFDIILMSRTVRAFYNPTTEKRETVPLTASEFKNLAGRAGRPGNGIEGMTLIAVPIERSTTLNSKQYDMTQQLRILKTEYNDLMQRLEKPNPSQIPTSPFKLLLGRIINMVLALPGIFDDEDIENWLEETAIPEDDNLLEEDMIELFSALDSLDQILLSAIVEAEQKKQDISYSEIEAKLKQIWSNTYTRYVADNQDELERIFVKRGLTLQTNIYPDKQERRKLYRLGLNPAKGRAFLQTAIEIEKLLRNRDDYIKIKPIERLKFFTSIIETLLGAKAITFSSRFKGLNKQWEIILAWWLQAPDAKTPGAGEVRDWLGFACENFEYRTSIAIEGVLSLIWERVCDDDQIPSLKDWRIKTDLPWISFWCSELLRWGTLNPLTAFLLSKRECSNRRETKTRINSYKKWIKSKDVPVEEYLSPLMMQAWLEKYIKDNLEEIDKGPKKRNKFKVKLKENFVLAKQEKYRVLPGYTKDKILWLDPAGYVLAESKRMEQDPQLKTLLNRETILFPHLNIVQVQ